ncbi:unnamed protein product [Peniophora sp. CBMAI 1063]|nr:unnamed protein product [Peniophora sp. CBMAI 1063]
MSGGDGATSRKDALDALDGTQGYSAAEWKDYYLSRMDEIDAIIRATATPQPPSAPALLAEKSPEVKERSPVPAAMQKPTISTGMCIRIPSTKTAKKAHVAQEVIEINDDSPRRPVSKPRKVSATKSTRGIKKREAITADGGPPKIDYSKRNKSVTNGDLNDVAQWIVSHGDAWSTMSGTERWKTYSRKNTRRSCSGWQHVSKYYAEGEDFHSTVSEQHH